MFGVNVNVVEDVPGGMATQPGVSVPLVAVMVPPTVLPKVLLKLMTIVLSHGPVAGAATARSSVASGAIETVPSELYTPFIVIVILSQGSSQSVITARSMLSLIA